jgi:hypothetical protein
MKFAKKTLLAAMISTSLLCVPAVSKAGIISDILSFLNQGGKGDRRGKSGGNSVPVNGGLVVLMIAGVGLGAKMIYDQSKKEKAADVSI